MTTIFANKTREPDFARYKTQWESALLAHTVTSTVSLEDPDQKALLRIWLVGLFNGAGFAAEAEKDGLGGGSLDWRAVGPTQFDLIYCSTFGISCTLGRVYMQPNGTWGAMVIAGVKDELPEAMASAEWAIARLSS